METQNPNTPEVTNPDNNRWSQRHSGGNSSGRVFGGLIVLTVGVIFLARQLGVDFPHWLVSWPMILIAVGFFLGFRHSFRGPAWAIMLVIGSIFLVDDIVDRSWHMERFLWPMILIAIGLMLVLRPKKKRIDPFGMNQGEAGIDDRASGEDFIDSVIIFGGIKRQIISKGFRGGKITTIFGGTELNLTQADVNGRIELDLTQIFGGTKLIVPPHWKIHSEDLVNIFGGLDDKRPIQANVAVDNSKVLVLKGTCIFGGIDIKSF